MTVAIVVTSAMPNVPVLSGTEGSLVSLMRYLASALGWDIIYDANNKIVIRPQPYKNGQALFFRINDRADRGGSAPRVAEIRAYESMSDIDTGAGLVGITFIHKSYYASTAAQKYYVIGDSHGFFFSGNAYRTITYDANACCLHYFGFLNRYLSSDIPVCGLFGNRDGAINGVTTPNFLVLQACTVASVRDSYIHKNRTGLLGIACAAIAASSHQIAGRALSSLEDVYWFSDGYMGQCICSAPYVNDGAVNTISGLLPGFYGLHSNPANSGIQDIGLAPSVLTPFATEGKSFLRAQSYTTSSGSQYSAAGLLFDIGEGFRP